MFVIETGNLKLRLEIVRVESLFQHEEIIPHVVDRLTLAFKNWAKLQNPIIVDESHIILDGNHRAFVFRKLNFKYMPVCKIDYFNENTKLRYWFRMLGNLKNADTLKRIVEETGGRFQRVNDKEALSKNLACNTFHCGIQQGDTYIQVSFPENIVYDAVSAYHVLEQIQNKLIARGIELTYIPCQAVHEEAFCDALKDGEIIIWTPQITKEMVVDAAKREKVFAPKTTRHIIRARPLHVNIPIYWLKEDISLDGINEKFSRFLRRKKMRRFGPGQVIDGRYYEEELFVFFDEQT